MNWSTLSREDRSLLSALQPSLRIMAGRSALLCLVVWIYLTAFHA